MTSNRDLRKYQDDPIVLDAFSRIVSGKKGYKAVIERREEPKICSSCKKNLLGEEKFCPDCGTKTNFVKK